VAGALYEERTTQKAWGKVKTYNSLAYSSNDLASPTFEDDAKKSMKDRISKELGYDEKMATIVLMNKQYKYDRQFTSKEAVGTRFVFSMASSLEKGVTLYIPLLITSMGK